MKIAIDISPIVYGTGVSVYTKFLVENLLRVDKSNEYVLLGMSMRRGSEIKTFLSTLQGATHTGKVLPIAPTLADIIWNKLHILPIETFVGKVDVFHSSDWTQPPSKAFKVTTIHDLTPIKYPEFSLPKVVAVHTRRLDWVKKEADRVIVPSESTKKDAAAMGIDDSKIRVVPEASDTIIELPTPNDVANTKGKFGLDRFLLVVGTNPRKNTKRIIEAYQKVKLTHPNLKLVVIGEKNAYLPSAEGVMYAGYVKDEDARALYESADALVYASIYEGFGLPILHAFAVSTPVVTSNVSSMPEVAGDAAVLVDPNNTQSIADGIMTALDNKDELVRKGLTKVKEFSWERTARETLKVYQEAAK